MSAAKQTLEEYRAIRSLLLLCMPAAQLAAILVERACRVFNKDFFLRIFKKCIFFRQNFAKFRYFRKFQGF